MQVITPNQVMGGGQCVICVGGIDRHTQTMTIDTLYDFDLPGDPLDGRKYVCQGCISDIVRTCGFLTATEAKELKESLMRFKGEYQSLLDAARVSSEWLNSVTLPIVPDVSFATPNDTVLASEALENVKPKRGRPAKEPF